MKHDEINNPLEPMKVEQALRSEEMKLEYRKSNKPSEINELDYTVIEALKKQMPQKIINVSMHDGKFITGWKCPLCKSRLTRDSAFCHNCGQALDRSGNDA